MSMLCETVRIEGGRPQHLSWHLMRMTRARKELWGLLPLAEELLPVVPDEFSEGLVRCNIYYGLEIEEITFRKAEKRSITSLKLVAGNEIDYHLKYAGREALEALFLQRGECDEILIVRNGLVTDTSISNIIFTDGRQWVTPAQPLLKGTCRERLISEGFLSAEDIRTEDLDRFTGCKLINALRYPEEAAMVPVEQIVR